MELRKKLDQDELCRMETLIEWFSTASAAPIRPLDMFNVNYASGSSVTGLILTYMIILLQLRLSNTVGLSG